MRSFTTTFVAAVLAHTAVQAGTIERRAQGPYAQCGGTGFSGGTTCESGWTCVYQNDYYSQCLPSSGGGSPPSSPPSSPPASPPSSPPASPPSGTTTVYLCGDSTMAKGGGGSGTEGWGQYLQYSFKTSSAVVVNKAIGGRSARSYTREGRFDEVIGLVKKGDWVVIEFGHNDGGSLSTDNGRSDCFGDGEQTCQTTYGGVAETVYTFPHYLKAAGTKMIAKGAKVVFSSPTPNNVWEGGSYSWGPDRFYYYTWLAAEQLGGPPNAYFVPHGQYAAQAMKNLGSTTINANYPNDHTHTAPYLADVMAKAFTLGLKCGTSDLGQRVQNSTASMTSTFLGSCVTGYNSTITELLR